MIVLSLFDGVSCGRLAFERAGVPVTKYYASEIDKHTEAISRYNYPDIVRLGDVTNWQQWQIEQPDIIIGGSPCQDLSIAKQERKGLRGERSSLFFAFVNILNRFKPQYFLFENVSSMAKADKDIITQLLGVEPILINSALVSAQQRKRLYWTNIPVEQPEDKGIVLQDVLESGLTGKDKSNTLTASYHKRSIGYTTAYGCEVNTTRVFTPIADRDKSHAVIGSIGRSDLKTYLDKHKGQVVFGAAERTRNKHKHLEVRKDDKSNALTTVRTDSLLCVPDRIGNINGKTSQGYRVYSVKGKSVALTSGAGGVGAKTGLYKVDLPDGDYIVRKLTPLECERLQTLPDNYTLTGDYDGTIKQVSDTQRYKAIGNGWTVDVIAHILKGIK